MIHLFMSDNERELSPNDIEMKDNEINYNKQILSVNAINTDLINMCKNENICDYK